MFNTSFNGALKQWTKDIQWTRKIHVQLSNLLWSHPLFMGGRYNYLCACLREKKLFFFGSQYDINTIFSVNVLVNLASMMWKVSAKVSPLIMFTFPYIQVKIQLIFSLFFSTFLCFLFSHMLPSQSPKCPTNKTIKKYGPKKVTATLETKSIWNVMTTRRCWSIKVTAGWNWQKTRERRERSLYLEMTFS